MVNQAKADVSKIECLKPDGRGGLQLGNIMEKMLSNESSGVRTNRLRAFRCREAVCGGV